MQGRQKDSNRGSLNHRATLQTEQKKPQVGEFKPDCRTAGELQTLSSGLEVLLRATVCIPPRHC